MIALLQFCLLTDTCKQCQHKLVWMLHEVQVELDWAEQTVQDLSTSVCIFRALPASRLQLGTGCTLIFCHNLCSKLFVFCGD